MNKNYFFKQQYCSTNLSKISLKSTDKELFLPILSVIAIFRASHLRTEDPFYKHNSGHRNFVKCSAWWISAPNYFWLFPSWKAIVLYTKKRIRFAIDCKYNPFFAYYWIEFIFLKGDENCIFKRHHKINKK